MDSNKHEDSLSNGLTLLYTLKGHTNIILQTTWMPQGQTVLSASSDNSVRFWRDGECYHQLQGQGRGFTGALPSVDGQLLVTNSLDSPLLEVWQIEAGTLRWTLDGHQSLVNGMALSSNGRYLVSSSDDETLIVWSMETGQLVHVLRGHQQFVWAAAITPNSRYIVSASGDATLKIWDLELGREMLTLHGHHKWVTAVVVSPDGRTVVSGSDDTSICVWDLTKGELSSILTGHTGLVSCLAFSADGRLLASKGVDHTVRLWRTDTWEQVALLDEVAYRWRGYYPQGLAFHPHAPVLATLGEKDTVVRLWRLDYGVLLNRTQERQYYATSKIALVGAKGVGKTGLAYRLTHEKQADSYATLRQHTWVLPDLSLTRADGTICEAVLWDFTGQADPPLLRSLFLQQIDVALLLVDPTTWENPFEELETWLGQLRHHGRSPRLILVGARVDSGPAMLQAAELQEFCRHHGIQGGYVATSALNGMGMDELVNNLRGLLEWQMVTTGVPLDLYQTVRDYLYQLKTSDRAPAFITVATLRDQLSEFEVSDDELLQALYHLENHGVINVLRQEKEIYLLLAPDLLVDLVAAILSEARRIPRGLGTLERDKLLQGGYKFKELLGVEAAEQSLLLNAALKLLAERHAYFTEFFEGEGLLIFPSLITPKRPLREHSEVEEDTTYRVKGDVRHIYAALVVLLNYPGFYTRTYQWHNHSEQAQYLMGRGEVCGFRKVDLADDEIELVLYYGKDTRDYTRSIFHGLFEKFLYSRSHITVMKYPAVLCSHCYHPQNRLEVISILNKRREYMYCAECGHQIDLQKQERRAPLAVPPPAAPEPATVVNRPATKNHFNDALHNIRDYFLRDHRQAATCFISHAWGVQVHEQWVARLADHLVDAGIQATIDTWDTPNIGGSILPLLQKIEQSHYLLVVGTPLYRKKFETKDSAMGSAVAEEIDLISQRLNGSEEQKKTVLPLLLDGDDRKSFPDVLHGRVRIAFQQERFYFVNLFNLILSLYGVKSQDPIIGELRKFMQDAAK